MISGRTSIKTGFFAVAFFVLSLFATWAAETFYERTTVIRYSVDGGQAWNPWDYVAFAAMLLTVAFVGVTIMFLDRDD